MIEQAAIQTNGAWRPLARPISTHHTPGNSFSRSSSSSDTRTTAAYSLGMMSPTSAISLRIRQACAVRGLTNGRPERKGARDFRWWDR